MYKRTIRISDEEGWRHKLNLRLRHCNRVAVEQKLDLSGENADFKSEIAAIICEA